MVNGILKHQSQQTGELNPYLKQYLKQWYDELRSAINMIDAPATAESARRHITELCSFYRLVRSKGIWIYPKI